MSSIQISIIDPTTDKLTTMEIDANEVIENVKALIEVEFGIPIREQVLRFNNQNLKDQDAISKYKIQNNDVIMVFRMAPQVSSNPLVQEAQRIKQYYENNPDELQFILHQNPDFANAVLSDNSNELVQILQQQQQKKLKTKMQAIQRVAQLESDPLNPELQKQIEEEINQKNVQENFEFAQEYAPENFGNITMLYIEITVNKHPIQAFVDSGAQSTIMSRQCAERCGILRYVDRRYAGMAIGVGTQKILGRIHVTDILILDQVDKTIVILDVSLRHYSSRWGWDRFFIRIRHAETILSKGNSQLCTQCSIDLARNKLVFPSAKIEVPFLSEGEIHKSISIEQEQKLMDEQLQKDEKPAVQQKQSQQPSQPRQQQPQQQQPPQQQQQQQAIPQQKKKASKQGQEEKIDKLIGMGFQRNEAIQALNATNGNVDMAAALLTQQKYGF